MKPQLKSVRAAIIALVAWAATALPFAASAEVNLVMVEEPGCIWCARWNADVSPEYALTAEGRAAPLRRINKLEPLPADLELKGRLAYTPTFILVRDGKEISRLEGYPGEDFFWGLLQRMLNEAGIDFEATG